MATDAMRVAKAICAATSKRHYSIDRGTDEAWAAAPDYARSEWVADAEAALTAMRSAEPAPVGEDKRRKIAEIIVADYPGGASVKGAMEYALSQADLILALLPAPPIAAIEE